MGGFFGGGKGGVGGGGCPQSGEGTRIPFRFK